MKTFIVHVSVDAESKDRAKEIVEDRIHKGRLSQHTSPEDEILREGEVAVVLNDIDEIEEA